VRIKYFPTKYFDCFNIESLSWNLYDNEDPGAQLAWLVNILTSLESQGRKVIILAHIPPGGGSCVSSWAREFKKILHRQACKLNNWAKKSNCHIFIRFENTISAQFNGHSHSDQFFVYYDPDDLSRASGTAFIPGSMTPYSHLNPAYRIYTMEGTYPGTQYVNTNIDINKKIENFKIFIAARIRPWKLVLQSDRGKWSWSRRAAKLAKIIHF